MTEVMDDVCAKVFLLNQDQLFSEPVANNEKEAIEFLKDNFACVFDNKEELIQYLKDEGVDYDSNAIDEILEVFELTDGRYLYVEA